MKIFLSILILFSFAANSQAIHAVAGQKTISGAVTIDSAKFNFNVTARSVTGFADISGQPHSSVLSATQNGITCSTRATTYWTPTSSTTAVQNGGQTSGTYGSLFPQNVVVDYMYSTQTSCADGNEQLAISGLNPSKQYTIYIIGSRLSTAVGDATRNVTWVVKDNAGRTTQSMDIKGNTSNYVTFSHQVPNGSGIIYIGTYGTGSPSGSVYGYFNGLIIKSE